MHLFQIVQFIFIGFGICCHTVVIPIKGFDLRLLVWMLFVHLHSLLSHKYHTSFYVRGIVLVSHCRRHHTVYATASFQWGSCTGASSASRSCPGDLLCLVVFCALSQYCLELLSCFWDEILSFTFQLVEKEYCRVEVIYVLLQAKYCTMIYVVIVSWTLPQIVMLVLQEKDIMNSFWLWACAKLLNNCFG